jgi:hypothetical protein
MNIPEEMTGAAHRAEVWAEVGRILVTLLRQGEDQRALHAPRAISKYSRVSDEALREVLGRVFENEQRELQALGRWKLVRVADGDARHK